MKLFNQVHIHIHKQQTAKISGKQLGTRSAYSRPITYLDKSILYNFSLKHLVTKVFTQLRGNILHTLT